ncbi:MAG: sel1 repeat family protein [Holosporales bacterium]|jgi:TPR repeat protein|nr:sel1 repeat family protein [Holosporales bacterium]
MFNKCLYFFTFTYSCLSANSDYYCPPADGRRWEIVRNDLTPEDKILICKNILNVCGAPMNTDNVRSIHWNANHSSIWVPSPDDLNDWFEPGWENVELGMGMPLRMQRGDDCTVIGLFEHFIASRLVYTDALFWYKFEWPFWGKNEWPFWPNTSFTWNGQMRSVSAMVDMFQHYDDSVSIFNVPAYNGAYDECLKHIRSMMRLFDAVFVRYLAGVDQVIFNPESEGELVPHNVDAYCRKVLLEITYCYVLSQRSDQFQHDFNDAFLCRQDMYACKIAAAAHRWSVFLDKVSLLNSNNSDSCYYMDTTKTKIIFNRAVMAKTQSMKMFERLIMVGCREAETLRNAAINSHRRVKCDPYTSAVCTIFGLYEIASVSEGCQQLCQLAQVRSIPLYPNFNLMRLALDMCANENRRGDFPLQIYAREYKGSVPALVTLASLSQDNILRKSLRNFLREDDILHIIALAAMLNDYTGRYVYACELKGEMHLRDFPEPVLKQFQISANAGHARAQYYYGEWLSTRDVPRYAISSPNFLRFTWRDYLQDSADKGDAVSQYDCGEDLWSEDPTMAVHYLTLCAEQGYALGLYRLGVALEEGHGIKKNMDKAVLCYRKSSDKGNRDADFRLGMHYIKMNDAHSKYMGKIHLDRCAKEGNHEAQITLGMYYFTQNDPQYEYAFHYFEQAKDYGTPAMYANLGWLYLSGHGGVLDIEQAVHYIRLSAEQHDPYGLAYYGRIYMEGTGVERDLILAHRYLLESVSLGASVEQDLERCVALIHEKTTCV